ncbi:MAG TPA: HAD family hydrolase [Verrucomicrobiae bacterium]|nr:HAD family hydrolase [Verrucomicrobiae bacterium]
MKAKPKYTTLATDYDGTIAQHGDVTESTHAALIRWKDAGRKLIMVTGRELPDLQKVCPFTKMFDCIVAENGALLYWPAKGKKKALVSPPPKEFIHCLRERGVSPLSFGEVIVATQETYKGVVLAVIEDLGLKLRVILNKGALMVLPASVDKATGLTEAANALGVALADIAGVGDAENDQMFLTLCGYSAAVGNALTFLKKQVHYVTKATHGAGVEELIEKLLSTDNDALPEKSVQPELFEGADRK